MSNYKGLIEQLRQEQARLEELLFLVDPSRRPRVQKMLAHLRAQILATEHGTSAASKTLEELRKEQADLEESLFAERPEGRARIKKMLAELRVEISAAEKEIEDAATSEKADNQGGQVA